ncbi:unnamed protein product [Boreogadus saida]
MKRSYESGSHKKKKKDQRQDFLSKLPKLSTFFTATAVAAGTVGGSRAAVNVVCCHVTAPFIPSGSGSASSDANDVCQQTDGDYAQLVVNISHSPSTSVIEIDDNNDNNDCETHILVDDPALWPKLLCLGQVHTYSCG